MAVQRIDRRARVETISSGQGRGGSFPYRSSRRMPRPTRSASTERPARPYQALAEPGREAASTSSGPTPWRTMRFDAGRRPSSSASAHLDTKNSRHPAWFSARIVSRAPSPIVGLHRGAGRNAGAILQPPPVRLDGGAVNRQAQRAVHWLGVSALLSRDEFGPGLLPVAPSNFSTSSDLPVKAVRVYAPGVRMRARLIEALTPQWRQNICSAVPVPNR